ncbi:MAG TPA: guanylate kinase [Tepidisphaeraceae bacterium]|jgi:guanylate kinase|nr:guanylate kinase [Tepidisphaeraceae bacterium]
MANKQGQLVVLCGPSGVGKSTISRRLSELLDITYTISATTRPKRPGDEAGKKYEFVTKDEFFRRLDRDEFLEYAEVYGEYYGTPKAPVLMDLARGHDVLLEIDVQGALQVRHHYPDSLLFFILPPDEPTLIKRLKERGRDSDEDIARRFRLAKGEIYMVRGSRAFDHIVINDTIEQAVDQIAQYIKQKKSGGL